MDALSFVATYRDIRARLYPQRPRVVERPPKPARKRPPIIYRRDLIATIYEHPIGPVIPPGVRRRVLAREIISAICETHGVSVDQVLGDSHKPHLVRIRAIIAHVLHGERGLSKAAIGRLMDRDHTSIINLLRTRKPDGTRIEGVRR